MPQDHPAVQLRTPSPDLGQCQASIVWLFVFDSLIAGPAVTVWLVGAARPSVFSMRNMDTAPEFPGPCLRCSGLNFWRDRDDRIRCAHCDPARAAWLIRERIRADPTKQASALERAVTFVEDLFKSCAPAQKLAGRELCLNARTALAQALKAGIAPATLTRASWKLGLFSVKTRPGLAIGPAARIAPGCFLRLRYRDRMSFPAAPFPRAHGTHAARSDRPAHANGIIAPDSTRAVARPQGNLDIKLGGVVFGTWGALGGLVTLLYDVMSERQNRLEEKLDKIIKELKRISD